MSSNFSNNTGNRRRFLGSSAGAAAGILSMRPAKGDFASEPLRVAVVGVRSRGRQLIKRLTNVPAVTVSAICDIDPAQAARASGELRDLQSSAFRIEKDYRRLLKAGDVDAIVIATPDHWHATMCIDSLAAGKHVFVETPLSHSIDETKAIMDAASQSDRVLFCGMQQRSMPHIQSALAHLSEGHLGTIRLARAWTSHRRKSIGMASDGPPPIGVDYSMWLGPAPTRDFNPNRFHYSWRWFWDYGGGELTNWGVHMIDIARLGMFQSRDEMPEVRITTAGGKYHFNDDQETPDTLTANFDFGDRTLIWEHRQWCPRQIEGRSAGVAFYGENGTLILDRGGWKVYDSNEKVAVTDTSRGDTVVEDFVADIATRNIDRGPLESIAASTDLCHRANQVYRESV